MDKITATLLWRVSLAVIPPPIFGVENSALLLK